MADIDERAGMNTDRELWREPHPEGEAYSYCAPSIHVTERGGVGINVGGTVIVKTLRDWHALAFPAAPKADQVAWGCAARKNSLPEPADCDWPNCGCDPYANKVIEALEENAALPTAPAEIKVKAAMEMLRLMDDEISMLNPKLDPVARHNLQYYAAELRKCLSATLAAKERLRAAYNHECYISEKRKEERDRAEASLKTIEADTIERCAKAMAAQPQPMSPSSAAHFVRALKGGGA